MGIIKTIRSLVAVAGLLISTLSGNAQLIITGVVDGPLTNGTPKAIELYALVDIPDLSLYGIELVSNAGTTAGAIETAFAGSLAAGEYYYLSTESAPFEAVFGFAPDQLTNDVNHNGDDDFYIYGPGNVVLDSWGASDGVDNTGTSYDIVDSWAYRISGTGPSGSAFNPAEWNIAPPDSLDGLDASQVNAAVPFGTYVIPEPSSALLLALASVGVLAIRRRR